MRERETRRRRRRVKKNDDDDDDDDDDDVFFCARSVRIVVDDRDEKSDAKTHLLSLSIPAFDMRKRRLFNAFFFPKNIKKEIPTTTTTMPRVVAAAAQQKTNTTTVGAALLTDRASRTLIETQLRVALDAVCYQRGARERRRRGETTDLFFSFATTFDFEF